MRRSPGSCRRTGFRTDKKGHLGPRRGPVLDGQLKLRRKMDRRVVWMAEVF